MRPHSERDLVEDALRRTHPCRAVHSLNRGVALDRVQAVGNATVNTTKRAVCRELASILKGSPLQGSLDPKEFFMWLHSRFDTLMRGSTFDLCPVWDALGGPDRPQALFGLFLQFREACEKLGLEPKLPEVFASLSAAQEAEALRLYLDVDDEFTPLPEAFLTAVEVEADVSPLSPSEPAPLTLSTEALAPVLDANLRRELVMKVVQAVKAAPIGSHVDAGQLTFQVTHNLEDLIKGATFDFAPIIDGLRQIGTTDADIWPAAAKLESTLPACGLTLRPVDLNVDDETKERLLALSSRAAEESRQALLAAARGAQGRGDPNGTSAEVSDSDQAKQTDRSKADARRNAKASRLQKYGFRSWSSMPKNRRYIRAGVLAVLALAATTFVYVNRPNRTLDAAKYQTTVPMRSAVIADGVFAGTLDEAKWYKIPPANREAKLLELETQLRAQGIIQNMQIRDSSGSLVITTGSKNHLVGAKVIMSGEAPPTKRPSHPKPQPPAAPPPTSQQPAPTSGATPAPAPAPH